MSCSASLIRSFVSARHSCQAWNPFDAVQPPPNAGCNHTNQRPTFCAHTWVCAGRVIHAVHRVANCRLRDVPVCQTAGDPAGASWCSARCCPLISSFLDGKRVHNRSAPESGRSGLGHSEAGHYAHLSPGDPGCISPDLIKLLRT